MGILTLGSQTNLKIKMSQPTLNIPKVNGYKKYSTLSHQSRTTSVDTREIGKLSWGVTLNKNTTVRNPDQSGNENVITHPQHTKVKRL